MIMYTPLWKTMQNKGVTTYQLINKYGFSRGTLDRLKHNKNTTLNTIDDLCAILNCRVEEIVVFVPDKKKKEPLMRLFFYHSVI